MTQDNRDYMACTSVKLVPGLLLAGLGVVFLLSNLDVVPIYRWWQLWPVILVAIGATRLIDAAAVSEKTTGAVMTVAGIILLAATVGWVPWRVWELWPLALIGAGVVMLVERIENISRRSQWTIADSNGQIDAVAVFSGFKRRITTSDFRGADYVAVFGGGEVNLREAGMQADAAVVTVTTVFGGIELRVPQNWLVVNELVGIFGGHEDKTIQPSPDAPGVKRVILRGSAIFGGVTIKN